MIFVTGGTGLTGARLLYDLALAGKHITALRRPGSSIKNVEFYLNKNPELRQFIQWVEGDITERDSLNIISSGAEVYHCAGLVSFDAADKDLLYLVNVKGTENVVNACLEAGVKKLVHVSSVASLGRNSSASLYIDEETHWENDVDNSDYSISKYSAEREVWRGIAEGLCAVIVNPTVIIGPGNWDSGSMQLISKVDKGLSFYTEGVSGYIDVSDVSSIMISLMESEIHSQRYILNSENLSYKELFIMIAGALGKKPPSFKASPWMAAIMWRYEWLKKIFTGKKPLITRSTAINAFKKYKYRNDKIQQLLNYHFKEIDLSLKETCAAYLQQKK
jgi:dihydroflavonol-4-reductase